MMRMVRMMLMVVHASSPPEALLCLGIMPLRGMGCKARILERTGFGGIQGAISRYLSRYGARLEIFVLVDCRRRLGSPGGKQRLSPSRTGGHVLSCACPEEVQAVIALGAAELALRSACTEIHGLVAREPAFRRAATALRNGADRSGCN